MVLLKGDIMDERPKSITIISWYLIVSTGISLIVSQLSLRNPATRELMSKSSIPINVQIIVMYAGLLITLVSGIAMLKRQNWARFIYVGWRIITSIIIIATLPMKVLIIPSIIVFLIVVYFLFQPKANDYFKTKEAV
jgi:hypothetical protein